MEQEYTAMMSQRVTVLEVKVETITTQQQQILNELKLVNEQLARYKGAWGAIVMISAALLAAITLVLKYFSK